MNKRYIVGIENFETIKTAIMTDATDIVAKNGGVVYARVEPPHGTKKAETGVIVAGDLFAMIYGMARIIKRLSDKTGMPATLIIESISDLMEACENEN